MIYIRIGDAGEYRECETIAEVAETLKEANVYGPFRYRDSMPASLGIVCIGFEGQNYISAYRGKDVETPTRGLTRYELLELNRRCLR